MSPGQKTGSEYILFLHDENGTAYGFLINNGTTEAYYYYLFNAQGDVIGILDNSGIKVVEYTYDVWGKLISTTGTLASTIGQTNPIRYRGYYYDSETGFYYLQSRYYDAETGRFVNADGLLATGQGILGYNMFAYCNNNPVMFADPCGNSFWDTLLDVGKKFLSWFIDDYETIEKTTNTSTSKSSSDSSLQDNSTENSSDDIILYSEHNKKGTTNPSNREKHQKGQTRKQRDNNGEKKNNNPNWKPNPNKRRSQNYEIDIGTGERIISGIITVGAVVGVVYLVANDITGVGVSDDAAIATLLPIIWDNATKAFS